MASLNIINQAGPLPITKQIAPEIVGAATVVVAGSVWASTPDVMIGIKILLDGQEVGTAQIFSNGPITHRAVVPQHIPVTLDKPWTSNGTDQPPTPASYTIAVEPMNAETVTDLNDHITVSLVGGS